MNFDHCAKPRRACHNLRVLWHRHSQRVWARGARQLRGSTQSWCGTHLLEMCSPRGAHLPHGLRGNKAEFRKHGVTGVCL
eukprot:scaffold2119_cov67-Phaeocystis_antarctica.AAC.10